MPLNDFNFLNPKLGSGGSGSTDPRLASELVAAKISSLDDYTNAVPTPDSFSSQADFKVGPPNSPIFFWEPTFDLWQDDARTILADDPGEVIAVVDSGTGGTDRLIQDDPTYRPVVSATNTISVNTQFLKGDSLTASMGTGYTIGFNFKYTAGDTLVSLHDGLGANRGMVWVSGGKIRYYHQTGSSFIDGVATISTGTNYTLIWTNDMAGNAVIYVNGVSDITTAAATAGGIGQLSFGQEWDGPSSSNYITAEYPRIAIYGTLLGASDIAALHTWLQI